MKYFLDTEFIEFPCTIQLISIGIVCEDGREFYAESAEVDWEDAPPWVVENVVPNLLKDEPKQTLGEIARGVLQFVRQRELHGDFVRSISEPHNTTYIDKPEFWGYYADYDWVVFCWLFGSMSKLPQGWPMYCRDLKQWADDLHVHRSQYPSQDSALHNALNDARWNRDLFDQLDKYGRH